MGDVKSLVSPHFNNRIPIPYSLFIKRHVFLESLVSPHFNDGRLKRKKLAMDIRNNSSKVSYYRDVEIQSFPVINESHVFLESVVSHRFEYVRLKRKRYAMDSSNKVGYFHS